jgi:hypothetical protein
MKLKDIKIGTVAVLKSCKHKWNNGTIVTVVSGPENQTVYGRTKTEVMELWTAKSTEGKLFSVSKNNLKIS